MPNRLATATSPYLLQHADNPVDWWEWSDEAFAEAARRDVPVLLSVGYAACHWCHVMAHESFEDAAAAEQVNADFVAIKVDREERPDIDAVYMAATQAMTGQGGWPMTCFLTPAGEPFHCGTYYPPTARPEACPASASCSTPSPRRGGRTAHGCAARPARSRPGWPTAPPRRCRRPGSTPTRSTGPPPASMREFDARTGGFGGAPKFPPSMALEFLLRRHERDRLGRRRCGRGRGDVRADGPRRDVRPAGRRVRPLQRGRRLGRAALREDALRQRAAAAGVRAPGAGVAGSAPPAGRRGDRGVPAARPAHHRGRLRLRARRRHRRASRA